MTANSAKVIVKYRLRRLFNLLASGMRRKPKDDSKRSATARKGMRGWATAIFLSGFLLFQSGFQADRILERIDQSLGQTQMIDGIAQPLPAWNCGLFKYQRERDHIECEPTAPAEGSRISKSVTLALTLELILLLIATFFLNVSSKELTTPEWDLEWLITLPVPRTKLLGVRLLERTLVNAPGLLLIWPILTMFLWNTGFSYASVPLALVGAYALMFFESVARTLIDTGLRMVVRASTLRNLQATVSLASSGVLIFTLMLATRERPILFEWAVSNGFQWLAWTPPGLLVQILSANSLGPALMKILILAVEIFAVLTLALKGLNHLLRFGIVAGGSREGTKRIRTTQVFPAPAQSKKSFLSPIQRRELKLLARDRNFMVQTLLVPALVMGMQFFIQPGASFKTLIEGGFTQIAAITFGVAAYSMMFSAFQTLNAEGKSLWLLYTFPDKIENLLRQKVYLWLGVALLYPFVLFGTRIALGGAPDLESTFSILIVLIGIPIYSAVAACFGVFAADPLAEDPRQRVRLDLTYLFMILAGFYGYAIYAQTFWQKIVLMILSTLMALALVQKARDQLPYLLDPTEAPKPTVSLSDGLIAAMLFFVLQGIVTVFAAMPHKDLKGSDVMLAFGIAGAITFISLRLIYWRKKTLGVPKIFGSGLGKACTTGIVAGLGAGIIGLAYVSVIVQYGFFADSIEKSKIQMESLGGGWWIAILAVVLAPVFEEFIFRGIIFNGLKRTWPMGVAAVASSMIFAIVHPPVSVLPVFFLAMTAAVSYSRTGLLITPILAHAVYNFIVVMFQQDFLKLFH